MKNEENDTVAVTRQLFGTLREPKLNTDSGGFPEKPQFDDVRSLMVSPFLNFDPKETIWADFAGARRLWPAILKGSALFSNF
jgi:hypothetical protein